MKLVIEYTLLLIFITGLFACNKNNAVKSQSSDESSNEVVDSMDSGSFGSPFSLSPLDQSFSTDLVFSKDIQLIAPFRVMQSFDIDKEGNVYYSQIGKASGFVQGKTKAHEIYIIKAKPNEAIDSNFMTLKYAGHAANIAVEEDGADTYVWVSTNATKYSSGEYWDAQSVSRIKYESGKIYENGYGGESFFLNNGLDRIQAALDKDNGLICINATKNGTRYFFTYKLREVMALPIENFTFPVTIGGEEIGTEEHVVNRTVAGRNLSELIPLGSFSIPPGTDKLTMPNSYSFQGYDIKDGYIYFNEGNGNDAVANGGSSHAYVTIYNLQGDIVGPRTNVAAINDVSALVNAGITNNSGYMEAEGVKVKGSYIYLGYVSYQGGTKDYRRTNIFKYQIDEK